jgi:hypothetical protein
MAEDDIDHRQRACISDDQVAGVFERGVDRPGPDPVFFQHPADEFAVLFGNEARQFSPELRRVHRARVSRPGRQQDVDTVRLSAAVLVYPAQLGIELVDRMAGRAVNAEAARRLTSATTSR